MSLFSQASGFFSMSQDINKAKGGDKEQQEGVISDFVPELKVEMSDKELGKMAKKWEKDWTAYYNTKLKPRQKTAESYWLGKEKSLKQDSLLGSDKPASDNLIFESLETFLPVAASRNPEPTTLADNTEEGFALSNKVNKMLVYHAQRLKLKLRGKQATRYWALYLLGVAKIGWSEREDDITTPIIRPQKMIMDPEATIEEGGEYTGEYLGERKQDTAANLVLRFPSKSALIKEIARDKMGTTLGYVEWWTDQMLFWTIKNVVLDKVRNPHWNYDEEETVTEDEIDEFGNVEEVERKVAVPGKNHFSHPRKPYIFLSVFNIGNRPHDNTSLIEQNLVQQDIINKRQNQIDKNVDNMNGGWVVSMGKAGLTKEQSGRAARVLQKGGVMVIPNGAPREAIDRITGTGLPADVFNSLQDARNEMRGIFGTTGLTPQGTQQENTVRGKIITRGQDSSRIGGGVTEYLEQWYAGIYNWWVQMFYVYYDEEKAIPVLGEDGAQEWITLVNDEMEKKLSVTVKEGSLIPKDDLTRRNEAIDLWSQGAIDPLTLNQMLDVPNPRDSVKRLIQWQTDPNGLIGEVTPGLSTDEDGVPGAPAEPAILDQVPV